MKLINNPFRGKLESMNILLNLLLHFLVSKSALAGNVQINSTQDVTRYEENSSIKIDHTRNSSLASDIKGSDNTELHHHNGGTKQFIAENISKLRMPKFDDRQLIRTIDTMQKEIVTEHASGDPIDSSTTREFPASVLAEHDLATYNKEKNGNDSHSEIYKSNAGLYKGENIMEYKVSPAFVIYHENISHGLTQNSAPLTVTQHDEERNSPNLPLYSNEKNSKMTDDVLTSHSLITEINKSGNQLLVSEMIETSTNISGINPSIETRMDTLNESSIENTKTGINSPNTGEIKEFVNTTNTTRAQRIFIKLLKENIVLKRILHHIASSKLLPSRHDSDSIFKNRSIDLLNNLTEENAIATGKSISGSSVGLLPTNTSINSTAELPVFLNALNNDSVSGEQTTNEYENPNYLFNSTIKTYEYDYYDIATDSVNINSSNYTQKLNTTNYGIYSDPEPIVSDEYNEHNMYLEDDSLGYSVRKCCGTSQFFSLETQGCEESEGPTNFLHLIHELVLGDLGSPLVLIPGTLNKCPETNLPPMIKEGISNYTHLIDQGYLYDIDTAKHYDHNLYCLELVGNSTQSSSLTAAFCEELKPYIPMKSIRKCCPIGFYYDAVLVQCSPNTPVIRSIEDLVYDFSGFYSENTSLETGTLECQMGPPDFVDADKVYLSDSDQLCVSHTGRCYPSSLYCIEYFWSSDDYDPQPSAVYCPLVSFQKCCTPNQILQDNICVDFDNHLSPFITQLMATMNYQVGFPLNNEESCMQLLLDSHDDMRWWVTNSGYLSIDSEVSLIQTKSYCVDDSLESSNNIITMVYVCSDELRQSVVLPISSFDKGTLGKCCPTEQHLSPEHRDCAKGGTHNSLDNDPVLQDANVTRLGYTGFPECSSGKYHLYTFAKLTEDHVEFDSNSKLHVVSLDGKCLERKSALESDEFCIDYGWDAEDPELPSALVCVPEWDTIKLHSEKYNLTAALLGVSCCSLLVALVSLISMRVRRGLVTVKKMNTLAGRILISYVTAHLIGFLTLAVSMHIDIEDNTVSCMFLAGVMQFFLLAGFHWNTSICSESLLLTLRVSTSESRRFVYHSLWAWGVPALITLFALLMDIFRDRLPCGTITPRVGRIKCFFSDPDAALLYFYLPIALTLLANLVLLISSRTARMSRLKRLERVPVNAKINDRKAGLSVRIKESLMAKNQPTTSGHSGLRTHQNKNLWSESVRLVLWSGGTWLFEVVGFIAARYVSPPQERWYDYLWYLPAAINSLRGFGIFFILVMTPETRNRIVRALGTFKGKSSILWKSERSNNSNARKVSHTDNKLNNISMSVQSGYAVRNADKKRNLSVVTTVTNIPALVNQHNCEGQTHPRLGHSISQVERRASITSSHSSLSETEDIENMEVGAQRRSSIIPITLPSVYEEDDDFMETCLSAVPTPKSSPSDSVFSKDSSEETTHV